MWHEIHKFKLISTIEIAANLIFNSVDWIESGTFVQYKHRLIKRNYLLIHNLNLKYSWISVEACQFIKTHERCSDIVNLLNSNDFGIIYSVFCVCALRTELVVRTFAEGLNRFLGKLWIRGARINLITVEKYCKRYRL